MAIADHIGASPSEIVDEILSALSVFQKAPTSGSVRTITRYPGEDFDPSTVSHQLWKGLPALLVAYGGGTFVADSGMRKYQQTMSFSVICMAGSMRSQGDRLAGGTPLVAPGVEDMVDWVVYYVARALNAMEGIGCVAPVAQRWILRQVGMYAMEVEMTCKRTFDIYDEDTPGILATLGIVHEPTDLGDLWEVDNVTPKSDYPPTTDGGVTDL